MFYVSGRPAGSRMPLHPSTNMSPHGSGSRTLSLSLASGPAARYNITGQVDKKTRNGVAIRVKETRATAKCSNP